MIADIMILCGSMIFPLSVFVLYEILPQRALDKLTYFLFGDV